MEEFTSLQRALQNHNEGLVILRSKTTLLRQKRITHLEERVRELERALMNQEQRFRKYNLLEKHDNEVVMKVFWTS